MNQSSSKEVPEEIKGWNWGAFLLSWIWGIGNDSYIALLALIPFVGLVMIFVLGAKGSEWAWENKDWKSVEDFKNTQRKWRNAGLIFWGIIVGIILLGAMIDILNGSSNAPAAYQPFQPATQTAAQSVIQAPPQTETPQQFFGPGATVNTQYPGQQLAAQNQANCQASYSAWSGRYAGSTNGNTDQGLGAHYNTQMNVCLIEEHYTRSDGTEMYDVFDASRIGANPYILELDMESPSALQNTSALPAESLYQNGQRVNTSDPEEEYDKLLNSLLNQ